MGTSNSKTRFNAIVMATGCLVLPTVVAAGNPFLPTSSFHRRMPFMVEGKSTIDSASTPYVYKIRGGESTTTAEEVATTTTTTKETKELSLDDKVQAAMKKLGISPPGEDEENDNNNDNAMKGDNNLNCKDGVCEMPKSTESSSSSTTTSTTTDNATATTTTTTIDPHELAATIAKDMNVDSTLAMAAIGATATMTGNGQVYNEQAAREMIQQELDLISSIPEDSEHVQQLVQEGYDSFLSRRALAFADGNMDDARAILLADQMDAEEEERLAREEAEKQQNEEEEEEEAMRAQLRAEHEAKKQQAAPDVVEVKADFDPTALPTTTATPAAKSQAASNTASSSNNGMPKPARKEDVVFEATSAQLQELVLESPVPVLLDIHAEWCGPCKVLGPALEEMAIKSGGIFRLVKVDSDKNKPVSAALEVTALPTVFGIRNGKIVHMFQGMPRSEEMMKNFMMGLFGAAPFSPPVTQEESARYEELTNKLIKTAGSACFSFSARERLTDRITTKLDELVADESVQDVEGAATLIRTLLNNVVKNPYEQKYRKVNLANKKIVEKIGNNASCLAVLKSVGFSKKNNESEMTLGKGKKVINVAPLVVARDCIDNWILRNRKEMAALARKRKDEADHAKLQAEREAEEAAAGDEDLEEEEVEKIDDSICQLKLRLDGKKKVHDVTLNVDDPLSKVLEALQVDPDATEEEVQITCVAKRLVVKSSDKAAMKKTLGEYGLKPKAAIVVKVGSSAKATDGSSLKDRVAEKKSLKKGSHTMQSIGIYSKDDNNKAELIDGGGGVWYEHDVSEDEGEENPEEKTEGSADEEQEAEESAEPFAEEEEADE